MFTLNDQEQEFLCQFLGKELFNFTLQWRLQEFKKLPDGVWGTNRSFIIGVYDLYLRMGGDPNSDWVKMFRQHWEP